MIRTYVAKVLAVVCSTRCLTLLCVVRSTQTSWSRPSVWSHHIRTSTTSPTRSSTPRTNWGSSISRLCIWSQWQLQPVGLWATTTARWRQTTQYSSVVCIRYCSVLSTCPDSKACYTARPTVHCPSIICLLCRHRHSVMTSNADQLTFNNRHFIIRLTFCCSGRNVLQRRCSHSTRGPSRLRTIGLTYQSVFHVPRNLSRTKGSIDSHLRYSTTIAHTRSNGR